jgi:hypothetical protein
MFPKAAGIRITCPTFAFDEPAALTFASMIISLPTVEFPCPDPAPNAPVALTSPKIIETVSGFELPLPDPTPAPDELDALASQVLIFIVSKFKLFISYPSRLHFGSCHSHYSPE